MSSKGLYRSDLPKHVDVIGWSRLETIATNNKKPLGGGPRK